jgi:hypothetical protein
MKDVFIFLAINSPLICVAGYFIILVIRMNKQVKSLMVENNTLKHDAPSRIVNSYRIILREDNLRATIECGPTHKSIKIKFKDEMLDEYHLTPKELLNILQKHDESSFNGYCSKETLGGKRCKDICDKPHCGY